MFACSKSIGVYSSFKWSLIYIIFPKIFHLYHAENGIGDRSVEEHLKNLKTSRGTELDREVSIFAKKFKFYQVTRF